MPFCARKRSTALRGPHVCFSGGSTGKGHYQGRHTLPHSFGENVAANHGIQEWHTKCLTSQELIAAQIPWATAGADRSRAAREAQQQQLQQQRTIKRRNSPNGPNAAAVKSPRHKQGNGEDSPVELTAEEQLLGSLLEANEALTSVLRDYDDIERIGIERETLERSRQEVRLDRSVGCLLVSHLYC
jgi:hypothetical protein